MSSHTYFRYSSTSGTAKALNQHVQPGSTGEASCAQCDNLYKLSTNRTACIRMSGAASGSWQPLSCQTGYRLNLVSDNYKNMSQLIADNDLIQNAQTTINIWGPNVNLRWNNQWTSGNTSDFTLSSNNYTTSASGDKINEKLTTNKQWRMVTNYLLKVNESMSITDVEYVYDRNCVWVSGCSKLNDTTGNGTADHLTHDVNQFCIDCQDNFRLSIEEPKIWIQQQGWLPMPHSGRLQKTIAFRSGCIEVEGCFRNRPSTPSNYTDNIMNFTSTSCSSSGCALEAMTGNTDKHKLIPSPLHCMFCKGSNKRLTLSVGRRDSAQWYGLNSSSI